MRDQRRMSVLVTGYPGLSGLIRMRNICIQQWSQGSYQFTVSYYQKVCRIYQTWSLNIKIRISLVFSWRTFAIALRPSPNVELLGRRRTFHELSSLSLDHLMKSSTFGLGLSPVSTQLQCCALPVFHSVSYLDIQDLRFLKSKQKIFSRI